MRRFFTLLRYELKMLTISPSTYAAAVMFFLLQGLVYLTLLEDYSRMSHESLPSTDYYQTFWLPVFFMVPLLTMRSLSEERRTGALEALLTTPTRPSEVVLSKFFGAYLFYIGLWAITLSFPYLTRMALPSTGFDERLLDPISWLGGFTFVAITGTFFIAIGLLCSSLTRSQLVAGMLTFGFLFTVIVGGRLLMEIPMAKESTLGWVDQTVGYFQSFQQLEDFCRGIFDTRPLFLYVSNTLLLLGITTLIVEAKA